VKHLVLLHGWAMHSGMWGNFAQQLSQHYRVTLIDLLSHDNLDSIVEAVITELDDEPFYLLGWSFGGTVALQMTANFPNRIKGLILMAANPCFVAKENWAGMPIETFNTFSENFHVNSTATLQKFLSLQLQGSPTFLKETKRLFSSKDPADNLKISLNLLKISDLRDILKNLTCSVTAILSDNDALIPVEIGEKMQALQPNLELTILKNATHIPFITQPENCLNAICNAIR
jgi:pimeloyl-[acyl-carrier protein] methyl ester esterase